MSYRGATGNRRFSPRNSILFWLAALVALVGGVVVLAYHLLHGGPSNHLSALQLPRAASTTTRIALAAKDAPEAELRAAHMAAMRLAMDQTAAQARD